MLLKITTLPDLEKVDDRSAGENAGSMIAGYSLVKTFTARAGSIQKKSSMDKIKEFWFRMYAFPMIGEEIDETKVSPDGGLFFWIRDSTTLIRLTATK